MKPQSEMWKHTQNMDDAFLGVLESARSDMDSRRVTNRDAELVEPADDVKRFSDKVEESEKKKESGYRR